jgi:type II secretory pathway pseudopilin PulG
MRNPRGSAGVTLIEVTIASVVFGLMIVLLMGMLGRAMGSAEMDLSQTYAEDNVQNAVDTIIHDLKETSPAKVSFFQFVEDGRTQTAIVFPSARDQNNQFVYKIGAEVQSQPVWQCVRVYCYVPQNGRDDGYIYRYADYSPRSYTNPITVSTISATQIKLSDKTTFQRDGTVGANQSIITLSGRFSQLESAVPATEGPADFVMDPDLIDFAIQDQQVRPLRLTVRSEVDHRFPGLAGSVITTLTNEVLSRNRN